MEEFPFLKGLYNMKNGQMGTNNSSLKKLMIKMNKKIYFSKDKSLKFKVKKILITLNFKEVMLKFLLLLKVLEILKNIKNIILMLI